MSNKNAYTEQCCQNKSIYEITYHLNKKWLVCNECLEIEFFGTGIKEKVRVRKWGSAMEQHAIILERFHLILVEGSIEKE